MSLISSRIPGFKIDWNEEDIASVSEVIRRGFYWAEGPEIKRFEEALSSFHEGLEAVVVNSGTSAQHLAMEASIPRGSSVIVPSFTFIATANTTVHAGLRPVFADIESDTFGLDAEDVKERIDRNTKAIVVMHYAGQVARDTKALVDLAEDHGLLLIEDCAESMGARMNGRLAGTFGSIAFLSFCQNKIITTGEGGAILTGSGEIHNRARILRSHGRSDPDGRYFIGGGRYTYTEAGYNMRMPTICAALGISQLSRIDELIGKRREAASLYHEYLEEAQDVSIPVVGEDPFHVFQMYSVLFRDGQTRDKVKRHLDSLNIPSKVNFVPVHKEKYYLDNYGTGSLSLKATEEVSGRILTLPFYPGMPKEEIEMVSEAVLEVI